MPKETIFPTAPATDADEPEWRTCPSVVWSRDLYVQLGVVHASDPDGTERSMFTNRLERTQLDRLIAVLLRARSAVFGTQENEAEPGRPTMEEADAMLTLVRGGWLRLDLTVGDQL